MVNTLVPYEDQYWIYGGDLQVKEKGLTIGGYESTFFAEFVAAYILENSHESLGTQSTIVSIEMIKSML